MFTPNFRIPEQKIRTNDDQIIPEVDFVKRWLADFDILDKQSLLNLIIQLNRSQCVPAVRLEIMKTLESSLERVLDRLFKTTESIMFPINPEHLAISDLLQQFLLETSIAYQIIIHDIAEDEEYLKQYLGDVVPEALYMSMYYLSRLLVERFQLYLSEPKNIWTELNQIYLLAERIGAHENNIKNTSSIRDQYLKIAFLKILNPYRLMKREARKIYDLMDNWVQYCDLVGYVKLSPENHFVVDLLSDKPPHFYDEIHDKKPNAEQEFEGRVLNTDALRTYIDDYLLKVEGQTDSSYQSRMYNEMLQRIDRSITLHDERAEERTISGNLLKLVAGFRACHHFINERKTFNPQAEIDEVLETKLDEITHQGEDDSDINLINLLDEKKLLNKKNPIGELQSVNPFMKEANVIGDDWDKINTDAVINVNAVSSQDQLSQNLKEEGWQQRNESGNGMLLVSKNDIEMPIAVGMLVACRMHIEKRYCLAVVKWLRINPHKGIAIGIKMIAVQSKAIAVKGFQGVGAGGQFQQAFLIPENDTQGKGGIQHLIVPAGLYNIGSVLKVWINEKLHQVKIKDILMATDSFEQISFVVIENKKKKKNAA